MSGTPRWQWRIRSGFALTELLVVMAIITTLISLLMPAVQQSRSAARRTQCANHLRQIGLALLNYHDNHRCFPSGTVEAGPRGTALDQPAWSWSVMLLPYVERSDLFRRLDSNHRTLAQVLHDEPELLQWSLPSFVCPEDSANPQNPKRVFDTQEVAHANYVASAPNANVTNLACPGPRGFMNRGLFTGDSHLRLLDISDGTSMTFLAGERRFVEGGHASVWSGSLFREPYHIPQSTLETPYGSAFVQMQTGRMLNAPLGASGPG